MIDKQEIPTYIQIILTFLTSFSICFYAVPPIIKVAKLKNLYDEPTERKKHGVKIPTLGGIAIFAGSIFSICFWSNQSQIQELQYIIAALILMFFMGIKDDIVNLVAYKKLAIQTLCAIILVLFADIKLSSFYGVFSVYNISDFISVPLSILVIIFITNSINLIDGIDTLAANTGIIANTFFGTWFYLTQNYHYSILSFSMLGSLLAFLYFNKSPAKIFMGDTGSLILGMLLSIFAIKFIELNRIYYGDSTFKILSAPSVAIAVLIIPIFDTLRVFTLRIFQGRSPLSPDREHIHHILTDLGYSHIKTSLMLSILNILCIVFTVLFMSYNSELLLFFNFFIVLSFSYYFSRKRKFYKSRNISIALTK